MQDVWDRHKDSTHVNFIASGTVYTLMHRIFQEYKEPLYGRCNSIITLKPFTTSVIKQLLADYYPDFTKDDLLALRKLTRSKEPDTYIRVMEKLHKFSDNLYGSDFNDLNNYLIECNAYEEPETAHLKYIERVFIQKAEDDFDSAFGEKRNSSNN